jgi:hypothetical protein
VNCARILLLLTLLVTAPVFASTESEYRFRVMLGNSEIGRHLFRIERNGSELRVESEADFSVKLLVIEAYRYRHRANERWTGNCLAEIETRTNDNGKRIEVRGIKQDNAFVVERDKDKDGLPPCVMTFAYWNPAILGQARLLNSQTGEFVPVKVEPLGEEVIEVRGVATPARRYALRAPAFRIDVWYARDNRWVQLESTTESGKPLRYLMQ